MSQHLQRPRYLDEVKQQCKSVLRYAILFSFATNVLMLILPIYSLQVLDRVLSSHSYNTLFLLTLITLISFAFIGLFMAVRQAIAVRLCDWLDDTVAPDILRNTLSISAQHLNPHGTQNMRDLGTIKGFLTSGGFQTLMDAPWAPIFLLIVFVISPVLGLVSIVGAAVLLVLALLNEYATKKHTEESQKDNILTMRISDIANRNAEAIEAMGMVNRVVGLWQDSNEKVKQHQDIAANRSNIINAVSKSSRMAIQILIMATGAILALQNHMTVGGMIAASILTSRALAPFEAAIGMWKSLVTARDAYRRLNESLSSNPTQRGTMNLPEPKGFVVVDNIIFRPPRTQTIILKNVSFSIQPGEHLGVIGQSAAGKSTLAKLLVGIWPALSGTVRLDGADIYKWNRDDVGQYIGYLPQDVDLFQGTLKLNIARLDPDARDEDVIAAAEWAGVHDMILKFQDGYDTDVLTGLGTLSPGQKQRLALARALYGNPKLLVLDEPNSNLDGDGETALVNALRIAKQRGITAIVVAHKPSLVAHMDKVLMLRNGMVEAFGPKDEVLKRYTRPAAPSSGPQQPPRIVSAEG